MGARPRALQASLFAVLAAAVALMAGCGPGTPDDILAEAENAMLEGDPVEAELQLQRLLAMESVPDEVAIRAHLTRAINFIRFLGDLERGREEFEAVIELAGLNSEYGILCLLNLAGSRLQTGGGVAEWDEEIARFTDDQPLSARNQTEVALARWGMVTSIRASDEMRAYFPELMAAVVSSEDHDRSTRRSLALSITRNRVDQARLDDDNEMAIAVLEDYIALFPGSDPAGFMPFEIAVYLRQEGREEEAQRRTDAAFAALDERMAAAQTSPEQATVAIMRADALQWIGDFEAAAVAYEDAFNTYFDYQRRGDSMLNWAFTLARNGSEERARALATRAALEYPNTPYNQAAEQLIQGIDAGAFQPQPASPEAEAPVEEPTTQPDISGAPESAPEPEPTPEPEESAEEPQVSDSPPPSPVEPAEEEVILIELAEAPAEIEAVSAATSETDPPSPEVVAEEMAETVTESVSPEASSPASPEEGS